MFYTKKLIYLYLNTQIQSQPFTFLAWYRHFKKSGSVKPVLWAQISPSQLNDDAVIQMIDFKKKKKQKKLSLKKQKPD